MDAPLNGWHSSPFLRFLILGLVLWLGRLYVDRQQFFVVEAPTAQLLEVNYQDWARRTGYLPDDRQKAEIRRTELEDRVLFKEALRRKLYVDDPVVYQRLLKNTEFLGVAGDDIEKINTAFDLQLHLNDELVRRHLIEKLKASIRAEIYPVPALGEDLMRSRYQESLERWVVAPGVEMKHVFFSLDSPDLKARLGAAKERLAATSISDDKAYALGDKFLLGNSFSWMELARLTNMFGEDFTKALQVARASGRLPVGSSTWFGPIASAYGFHFVKVVAYSDATFRDFHEVKALVADDYRRELEARRLKECIAELLDRYDIEEPAE